MASRTDTAGLGLPPADHGRSRSADFYLILMAILWASNIYGFGTDSIRHLTGDGPAFPPIVHLHALAFVAWQVLMTVQILLVRSGRGALHRRIGAASIGLAAAMVPLGVVTAVIADATKLDRPGFPPAFLFLQAADMALFGLLVGWAYAARRDPGTHKRLMMIAMINLSTAGSGRWAHALIAPLAGPSFFGAYLAGNLPVVVLMAAMAAFDPVRPGRIHRVWAMAVPPILAVELFQTWVIASPAMNAAARSLLAGL